MAVAIRKPATAFERDRGRGDDPLQHTFTARALCDLRIGELLNVLGVALALLAFVFIKRHIVSLFRTSGPGDTSHPGPDRRGSRR